MITPEFYGHQIVETPKESTISNDPDIINLELENFAKLGQKDALFNDSEFLFSKETRQKLKHKKSLYRADVVYNIYDLPLSDSQN